VFVCSCLCHSEISGCFDVSPNGCCVCLGSAPKLGVLELIQSNLTALVRTSLLYGGRSLAHKVARLLALCLEYVFCRVYYMICKLSTSQTFM